MPAAAKTVLCQLYDGGGAWDTTVLQDFTWDSDNSASPGSLRSALVSFDDATLDSLTFGNAYRLGLAPQEVSANLAILVFTQGVASDWEGWPMGTQCLLSTRTDAGAWTDDALSRPIVDLILKDITEPAGAGMLVHPGMAGGMRG